MLIWYPLSIVLLCLGRHQRRKDAIQSCLIVTKKEKCYSKAFGQRVTVLCVGKSSAANVSALCSIRQPMGISETCVTKKSSFFQLDQCIVTGYSIFQFIIFAASF